MIKLVKKDLKLFFSNKQDMLLTFGLDIMHHLPSLVLMIFTIAFACSVNRYYILIKSFCFTMHWIFFKFHCSSDVQEKYFKDCLDAQKSNSFGLYEMHGNICEWTNDLVW